MFLFSLTVSNTSNFLLDLSIWSFLSFSSTIFRTSEMPKFQHHTKPCSDFTSFQVHMFCWWLRFRTSLFCVNITGVCISYVSDTGETCLCVKHLFVHGLFKNAVSVSHYSADWWVAKDVWSRHIPSETEETHDKPVRLGDTWTGIYIGHLLNTSLEQRHYFILLIYMKQWRFRIYIMKGGRTTEHDTHFRNIHCSFFWNLHVRWNICCNVSDTYFVLNISPASINIFSFVTKDIVYPAINN
jgi:hypothetical protein